MRLSLLAAFLLDAGPQAAPRPVEDFLLPSIEGGFGRLSDYRGKKVLLLQFASW